MTSYSIYDVRLAVFLAVFMGTIPIIGFWIASIKRLATARIVAWSFVVSSVLIVERTSSCEPPGIRMLVIVVALLWSMKAVVYTEARHGDRCVLTFWQWIAFCVGWPGMRAKSFKSVPGKSLSDWPGYIRRGTLRLGAGGMLIALAWLIVQDGFLRSPIDPTLKTWAATIVLMLGISLTIHFGIFNIVAGVWRFFGGRCSTLFRAPLLSRSLTEFWGRRWNLAFSEMTTLTVYRPLKEIPGNPRRITMFATIIAFLFSGMLHEIAISVPVGAGFGFPMLYFAIHALGIAIEKRISIHESAIAGRVWTAAWVLLPLPLLFHIPFLEACVWPIIGM